MKFQLSDIETRAEKMREKLNYKKLKESLYDSLKFLSKNFSDNREYITNLNTLISRNAIDKNVAVLIDECVVKQMTFESQTLKIDELRRLANVATLHPGAESDPSNTIKYDLFNFCESWRQIENDFAEILHQLRGLKQRQVKVIVEQQPPKTVEFFVEEIEQMKENFDRLKNESAGVDDKLLADFESVLASVRQFNEEVEGLNVW